MDEIQMIERMNELKKQSDLTLYFEFKSYCDVWRGCFRILLKYPGDEDTVSAFMEADANIFLIREEVKRRCIP